MTAKPSFSRYRNLLAGLYVCSRRHPGKIFNRVSISNLTIELCVIIITRVVADATRLKVSRNNPSRDSMGAGKDHFPSPICYRSFDPENHRSFKSPTTPAPPSCTSDANLYIFACKALVTFVFISNFRACVHGLDTNYGPASAHCPEGSVRATGSRTSLSIGFSLDPMRNTGNITSGPRSYIEVVWVLSNR